MHVSNIVLLPVLVDIDCVFECIENFLGMMGVGEKFILFWFFIPSFNITVMFWMWSSQTAMAAPTACWAQHVFCKEKLLGRLIWAITKLDFLNYMFEICSYIFYLSHANVEFFLKKGSVIYNFESDIW